MTKVTVYVDNKHKANKTNLTEYNYKAIKVEGHTRKDICAAISALAFTLAGALVNITGDQSEYVEQDGYLLVQVNEKANVNTNLIFETILIGLEQIQIKHKEHMHPIQIMIKQQ